MIRCQLPAYSPLSPGKLVGHDPGGFAIVQVSQLTAALHGAIDGLALETLPAQFEDQLCAGVVSAGKDAKGG